MFSFGCLDAMGGTAFFPSHTLKSPSSVFRLLAGGGLGGATVKGADVTPDELEKMLGKYMTK